ncbi:hypothetical protein M0P65_04210 [Candidatus Gracilibacteria bacterium]|nr:hypothetical protein [Candidatus Gracilibacteria bacterium]
MNTNIEKNSLSSIKQVTKANLKTQYLISKNIPLLGIVAINDIETRNFIIKGLSDIGIGAIVVGTDEDFSLENIASTPKLNSNVIAGFDFFIYDNEHESVDVVKFMSVGVVPIMPENNTFSGILKAFNPMKFEGNGFFYKKESPYCVFEKVISYCENIKFPEDKRVLLKNVTNTF